MILYHGSFAAIEKPDILHSRRNVDFGAGFYTTNLRNQAEKWSLRFAQEGKPAIISIYEFDESIMRQCRFLDFPAYDEEWLDFVFACRAGEIVDDYDLIQGGVSNDKVFNSCELFRKGYISKDVALDRLRYEKPSHQLCFKTQEIIDGYLHFVRSEKA
ncbi:MAG: DUF3990 domain-containing protein [Victivallaceae bacterium]|nr:DUF3990 domain-containing protein [Victivallaceae bacterium]